MLKDQFKSPEPDTSKKTISLAIAAEKVRSTLHYVNPKDSSNFARPRDLPFLTGLSRTTIWRLERNNEFPKRVRLSAGAVGYHMHEIREWCSTRQVVVSQP